VTTTDDWVDVGDGYQLALRDEKLVCRKDDGKPLRSVPKAVRQRPEAERLVAVRDWLVRHARECAATVETWMLGSFPLPATMLAQLWPDPAWRRPLTDLVVHTGSSTGFLRGVDERGRLGVLDLDAETRWLGSLTVTIPHPIQIDDLADVREFALELGVEQAVPQVMRETHDKPAAVDPLATDHDAYAGALFEQLRHATARAARFGFSVRGGYAGCTAYDDGVRTHPRYWLGEGDPSYETMTGSLHWLDDLQRPLPLGEIGPVAWSEGVRMATLIHAGRKDEASDD
jgi:Domain of unknown function (DUF4132)